MTIFARNWSDLADAEGWSEDDLLTHVAYYFLNDDYFREAAFRSVPWYRPWKRLGLSLGARVWLRRAQANGWEPRWSMGLTAVRLAKAYERSQAGG